MHVAPFDRRARRHQRLPEHLTAEHLGAADVAALAAEQIELQALERHHLDQVLEKLVHRSNESRGSESRRQHRAASA